MGESTDSSDTGLRPAVKIVDLGAVPDTEDPGDVSEQDRPTSRRRIAYVLSAAVVLLSAMALLPDGGAPDASSSSKSAGKKPDVCEVVMRANEAEANQGEPDQAAVGPDSSRYRLIATWPQGSTYAVSYGFIYSDESIQICGNPEDLANVGIPSQVRHEELGDLPAGMSYAYKIRSSGSPNQELELLGVRLPDDSVVEEVVLPNGEVRPL
ncbi:hypothetical protein [Arthrobacter sp. NPDC092385]|uniref:hypothetical protein n=1 Tax=Arthrobacter sp. NPDC092385 TaxID=3363943 RepID=UPI0037F88E2E